MNSKEEPDTTPDLDKESQDVTEVVRKITKLILNKKKPVSVYEIFKICDNKDLLDSVLRNHDDKFAIHNIVFVDLKTKVDICKNHWSKEKCSGAEDSCSGLHICKYYILSGYCRYSRNCSFGHDLNTEHNRHILEKNNLTGISRSELNYLFKKENNRIGPEICKFYNVENDTCKHSGKETACPFLHICRHFVNGTCKFGTKCRRSHELLEDTTNVAILQNHGISTNRKPNEVLKELQKMYKKCIPKDESKVDQKSESVAIPTKSTVEQIKKATVSDLDISLSSDISSDDDIKLPASVLIVKKEQMADEESQIEKKHDPCVDVTVLSDYLPFLYKSRRKGGAKKSKGKQSKGNKNVTENAHFAEVSITNYEGKANVLAYCVDCDGNIHPFNLHGPNCEDGVYKHECLMASDRTVKLFGESIIMPKMNKYEEYIMKTDAYLKKCGVADTKLCKANPDKQSVYVRVVIFLEDCGNKMISATSTAILKKGSTKEAIQETGSVKRATSCLDDGENAKRLRTGPAPFQKVKAFRSCYSGQNASTWGNFIDTSGYEESALTWQAHGEALQSVCLIVYPGGTATGFRVGVDKNYIMTARHVVDHIKNAGLRPIRRTTYTSLNNVEVYAVFGYLKDGEKEMKNKFYFNDIIHFEDSETDTAILELSESHFGTPMPPAFKYFSGHDFTNKFYFIGHSEGKPLSINKVDKIVDMNSKESKFDRANVKQISLNHTGRPYEINSVESLTNKHRFLFHCKFTKGASGSPGIVCLSDGRKVVVTMLLRGYPEWYYDPSMEAFKANWSKDELCVEQGVKLESLYKIMKKKNPELCNAIFCF